MCQCELSVLRVGLTVVRMTAEQIFCSRSWRFTGAKNPGGRVLRILKILATLSGVDLLNICFDVLVTLLHSLFIISALLSVQTDNVSNIIYFLRLVSFVLKSD